MSFIKKSVAAQELNLEIAELDIIASRRGIKRWTSALVKDVQQELEAQGITPQLTQSNPESITNSQPEIPHLPHEESQEHQQQKQSEKTTLAQSPQSNLTELQQHQRETKDALELVNQGLNEQFAQDAIALGQMDAVQKVALRVQSSRKTELHLLTQLAQSSQQTTQQQLQTSQSVFEGKMLGLNGTAETLGKAQLNSHSHQKKLIQTQSNLEEMIIF